MSWRKPVRLLVRRIARRRGYDVVEYPGTSFRRRLKLMRHFQVDLVLDIGADTGEYVAKLRRYGYEGWVVSFEPLPSSFAELRYNAGTDPLWETANFALGERDGRAALHIAGNAHSSSLHDMRPAHVEAAPQSAYVDAEEVDVRRLDSVFGEYRGDARRIYVKVDVQGAEREVLAGAARVMRDIAGVQLEMSLIPLYDGQALFPELLDFMTRHGFTLMSLEPGFADERTGQLLQVDGVFFRQ